MRLAGSSKYARVSGLGNLLGDTLAQGDLAMTQAKDASAAGDHASAYAAYKTAFNYYIAEENAATQRAQASGLASDWNAVHVITAKRERANTGMTTEADLIAKSTGAYDLMPQTIFRTTPEAEVSRTKIAKTLAMLNDPFPKPTAPPPPDELYFTDNKAYLRQALNTRNWDAVSKWYASQITEKLKTTMNASQYWELSQLDLSQFCDRTFDRWDIAAFMRKCLVKYAIFDLGTYVGIGYGGDAYVSAPNFIARCSLDQPNFVQYDPEVERFMRFIDSSHLRGPDRFEAWDAAILGKKHGLAVCWEQEPKFWTTHRILDTLAIVVGSAIVSYGIGAAFTAPAAIGGSAAAAGGAAAGAGGAAVAGATTGALVSDGVFVVTGTAIGASSGAIIGAAAGASIGAGIAAGSIVPSTAPPAITSPTIPAESIDTVVVTGTAIPAGTAGAATVGSVGGAIAGGAVVATNSPPPLTTQQPPPTQTPDIDTITVEGTQPVLPDVQIPIAGAAAGGAGDSLQPTQTNQGENQQSLQDRIKGALTNLIKEYGAQWVADHLAELLRNQLGRNPTQQELDAWGDWGNLPAANPDAGGASTRTILGVLGLLLAAALFMSKKKRGKGGAKVRRKRR